MKEKFKLKKYILIILASIIIVGDIYISKNILVTSFEQCLYGMVKLSGASASPIIDAVIYISIGTLLLCPLLLLPALDFKKKISISIKDKKIQILPIKNTNIYGSILMILSIFCLLNIVHLFPFLRGLLSKTDIFEEYYAPAESTSITFPEEKQNLIYIFLESMETSNMSVEKGGLFDKAITPNLEKLASENINFSNTDLLGGAMSSYGTGWTAAAMMAQTSGLPFKFKLEDIHANSTEFKNVTVLGDILNSNGYDNYLLLGSDVKFGGRYEYFNYHKYNISDYYTAIEEEKINSDYYEWWGYEDSKLFTYAKEKLEDISKNDKPFNLTILTADTHFTDGYLDKECSSTFDNHYANSFYCSDNMVGEFISWIKEQDFYENTTIIITGDHNTMQDNFYKNDDSYDRVVYNTFINAKVDGEYQNKKRIFTTMDMFPTTLASLGASIEGNRLGLGTNLFSSEKTIPELMGIDKFNSELIKNSSYYYEEIRK